MQAYALDVETEKVTLTEFANIQNEGSILQVTEDEIAEFESIKAENNNIYQDFLGNGGIIVLLKDGGTVSLDNALDIPFTSEDAETNNKNEAFVSDLGTDVAAIYYMHQGAFGVHEINIGSQDKFDYAVVEEVINDIREKQTTEVAKASDSGTYLGERDYTYTRQPKGKLNASYEFYTVQNYYSKDYYIVKANVTGMPGCDLGSPYETKYQGEEMNVSLSSRSTSVTRDAYGPSRTIGSSSYSVDLGLSFEEEITLSLGLSYSRNIDDTDIDVSLSSSGAEWDVTLTEDAQEDSFNFEPGITFDCPDNKASISISTYSSYTLDSWDTAQEVISLSKTFTAYSTSLSN
ncbi:MAG: hypothetical protein ACK5JH_13100 [Anaerocolumna sp.]